MDIGTRSVTGILLEEQSNEQYIVKDFYRKEHKERSVLDGQIHDIVAVSEVIDDVRKHLESQEHELTKVCVAAAGRALKTVRSNASITLNQKPITENEAIKHLEFSAVHRALRKLAQEDVDKEDTNYYCVGYSVLHYEVDGAKIGSLIDQVGIEAKVHIIATFLPKIVVESLMASLQRSGLQMEALTLEPIAAIQLLVPQSMRRLNVALVDVGAGTSDIAITSDGTIVAYGMVPMAGDEITEAIGDHYLLDFPEAETVKRQVIENGEAVVQDILGFETKITFAELNSHIDEKVDALSQSITDEILTLNHKSPQAVMLIGGGSLTPNLTATIAKKLGLPENRVAVRDIDAIPDLKKDVEIPTGPDFITPIGIAISAKQSPIHYMNVTVNHETIRMMEMNEVTVGDCLVQADVEINKYYGKPGLAAMVKVNSKSITIPGELGGSPTILLNGEKCSVNSKVQHGDTILIEKGKNGSSSKVTIKALTEVMSKTIYFDEEKYVLKPKVYVNQKLKDVNHIVNDKDDIKIHHIETVEAFLQAYDIDIYSLSPFHVFVNDRKVHIQKGDHTIEINGQSYPLNHNIQDGDKLTLNRPQQVTVKDLLKTLDKKITNEVHIFFNNKPVHMSESLLICKKSGKKLVESDPIHLNDRIEIEEKKTKDFIFQDVFRYIDLDLTSAKGHFELLLNGEKTTFFAKVNDGDQLEIIWN